MKITLKELFDCEKSLGALLELEFRAVVAFKVAKVAGAIKAELSIAKKAHYEVIKRYGKKDKKGNFSIQQSNPNYAKAATELEELMVTEVSLDCEAVELPNDIEIQPKVLVDLAPFLKAVEEKK